MTKFHYGNEGFILGPNAPYESLGGSDLVVSGVTTLTADGVYKKVTVEATGILNTAGFYVICTDEFINNGIVRNSGSNAVSFTGGSGVGEASFGGGGAGGTGNLGGGANGSAVPGGDAYGGPGQKGGNSGATLGGAGGSITNLVGNRGSYKLPRMYPSAYWPQTWGSANKIGGGTGGGGGAGDGVNRGGGGGGAGGVVYILADKISGTGEFRATGGNGAAGAGGNAGGGGGGGGGFVALISNTYNFSGSIDVSGGSAGAGSGTGAPGVNGSDGRVITAISSFGIRRHSMLYGDGSDGDVVVSAVTNLTAPMLYENLEIDFGATLNTNGYPVRVLNRLINNGNINSNGNNSTGFLGAAALPISLLINGTAGGTGNTGGGGSSTALTSSLGFKGGNGGAGGTGAAGNSGNVTPPSATLGSAISRGDVFRVLAGRARYTSATTRYSVSTGGGGGGGDGVNRGGGGGGPGGLCAVIARVITGSGSITANGGSGFSQSAGNVGGGGGGAGGIVLIVSDEVELPSGITTSATGGAAGNGFGLGANGQPGADGVSLFISTRGDNL